MESGPGAYSGSKISKVRLKRLIRKRKADAGRVSRESAVERRYAQVN